MVPIPGTAPGERRGGATCQPGRAGPPQPSAARPPG